MPCSITTNGIVLLSKCCRNLTYLNFCTINAKPNRIIVEFGRECSKLKSLFIDSSSISDNDLKPLLSRNYELEEIKIGFSEIISDACLRVIALNCRRLKRISLADMEIITDGGIGVLVSNIIDLQEIVLSNCWYLSDGSLMAIATHCNKLESIIFDNMGRFTDDGIKALVSANHDLKKKEMQLNGASFISDQSLIAIANNC